MITSGWERVGLDERRHVFVLAGPYGPWLIATAQDGLATGLAGYVDDDLAFVAPWGFRLADVAADTDEFQTRHSPLALGFVPLDSIDQDLRDVGKGLDIVQCCRLVP